MARIAASDHVAVDMGVLGQVRGQQSTQDVHEEPTNTSDLVLDGRFKEFFGQGLRVDVFVLVCVILKSLFNHKGASIWSSSFSCISVVCLIASFVLHLAGIMCFFTREDTVRFWLAYLSFILRIVAATFLLLSLDTVRHLVVILPLSLMVLVLVGSTFVQQNQNANQDSIFPGRHWKKLEAELKLGFDVSSQVVTFAFAGMFGSVLGYVKEGSSNQLLLSGRGRGYMAPDCFLLYSLVLGLLVQLLSTVAPYIYSLNTRDRTAKVYLRIVAYASLMFLVLASVMAAEEILHEWVFITCFIIVIIPLICFWLDNKNGLLRGRFMKNSIPTDTREENGDDKVAQAIFPFLTLLFGALMASNFKYSNKRGTGSIAGSLSGWFKCSVLMELYGVLSCAVRIVVLSEKPEMRRLEFPNMVWNMSAIATVIITIILLVVVVRLHPDEVNNIF